MNTLQSPNLANPSFLTPAHRTLRTRSAALLCASLLTAGPALHAQSVWTGGSGAWDSNGSPGWNGTGVPNSMGASVNKTDSTSATITQNNSSGVTIGSFTLSGGAGTFGVTLSNALTFNQDGGGAGTAAITNAGSNASSRVNFGSGTLTLADDILISNTGSSTNASGSIAISSTIGGAGNVTFSNLSNSASAGHITLSGPNTFTGTVTVQKGAVTFSNATSLGSSANAVYLGSAGNSATLVSSSNSVTHAYNITVVSTVGTNVLGSINTSTSDTTYSGTLALNGNVTLASSKTGVGAVRYTGAISGGGNVTLSGTGRTQFGDGAASVTNTYTGNTVLSETSSFLLADNAKMTFVIGASGLNNKISGTGGQAATLNGDFVFDLTNAAANGSWTIVDLGTVNGTFGSTFSITGFTEAANVWTYVSGTTTYTFTEATGVLSAVPEPSTAVLWGVGLAFVLFGIRRRMRHA